MSIFEDRQRCIPYAVNVGFTQHEFSAFQSFLKSRRNKAPNRIPSIKEIIKEIIMSAMIADGFWKEGK